MANISFSYELNYVTKNITITVNSTVGANPQVQIDQGWFNLVGGINSDKVATIPFGSLQRGIRQRIDYRDDDRTALLAEWYNPLISPDLPAKLKVSCQELVFNGDARLLIGVTGDASVDAQDQTTYNAVELPFYSSSNLDDDNDNIYAFYDRSGTSTSSPFPFSYDRDQLDTIAVGQGVTKASINLRTNINSSASRLVSDFVYLVPINDPLVVTGIKTDVSVNGASDGSIDLSVSGGVAPYTYSWNNGAFTTQDISGLTVGQYSVVVTDSVGVIKTRVFQITQPEVLQATFSKTNVTSFGGSDGTINVTASGGSGVFFYAWADDVGITTPSRTGLSAQTYTVTVSNDLSEEVVLTIELLQPAAPPDDPEQPPIDPSQPVAFLEVPYLQSLTFVNESISVDGITKDLINNSLYENSYPISYGCNNYAQIFSQVDSFKIQVKSDSNEFKGYLKRYDDDSILRTLTPSLKKENINITEVDDCTLESNFNASNNTGVDQTRVYFNNISEIIEELLVGDTINISGSAGELDNSYVVIGKELDTFRNQEYLIINVTFPIGAPPLSATVSFTYNRLPYNTYELNYDFSVASEGVYYSEIKDDLNNIIYKSEPLQIKLNPKNTNLITWTNTDNAYDLDYSTFITHKRRINSVFFKRMPSSNRQLIRNTDNSLTNLSSKPTRKILLETIHLPPYLHETLSFAFEHDVVKINGIEYISEDGYQEPEYIDKFGLSNSSIMLEQKNFLESYNGNDNGVDAVETGFIIINNGTEEGYIKR